VGHGVHGRQPRLFHEGRQRESGSLRALWGQGSTGAHRRGTARDRGCRRLLPDAQTELTPDSASYLEVATRNPRRREPGRPGAHSPLSASACVRRRNITAASVLQGVLFVASAVGVAFLAQRAVDRWWLVTFAPLNESVADRRVARGLGLHAAPSSCRYPPCSSSCSLVDGPARRTAFHAFDASGLIYAMLVGYSPTASRTTSPGCPSFPGSTSSER
jgi:hypothetical protein